MRLQKQLDQLSETIGYHAMRQNPVPSNDPAIFVLQVLTALIDPPKANDFELTRRCAICGSSDFNGAGGATWVTKYVCSHCVRQAIISTALICKPKVWFWLGMISMFVIGIIVGYIGGIQTGTG